MKNICLKNTFFFVSLLSIFTSVCAQTNQINFTTPEAEAKGKSGVISPPPLDSVVVNEQTLSPEPGSSAKMAMGLPMIVCNPTTPKSPASGVSGFIANACFSMSGAANGSQMTGAQPNHIVYFNNLSAGNTYTFVASAKGSTAKTKNFSLPINSIGSACMSARYNSTGGITYVFGFAIGLSKAPASLCV